MDSATDTRIAALARNVAGCRELADLALADAERLEQLAQLLERGAWQAQLRDDAAAGNGRRLADAERQLLAALTEVSAGWLRLMRAYSVNAAAAAGSAASIGGGPLAALGSFWSEADERFRALFPPAAGQSRSTPTVAPHRGAGPRRQ